MQKYLRKAATVAAGGALLSACATSGRLSKADKRFAEGKFEAAIALYQAEVTQGKNVAHANFALGEAYRLSNRIDRAVPYYRAALAGGVRQPELGYRYAQALRAAGQFSDAAAQFTAYAQSGSDRSLADRAAAEAQIATASLGVTSPLAGYDVVPLVALNSPSSDFSAARLPGTGELVFASGRAGRLHPGNGEGYLSLYARQLNDSTGTPASGAARLLEPLFNDARTLQASATYTPDGKTMVFARSNDGSKKGYLSTDLWISYFRAGAWTAPVLANLNDRTADDYAPAFAPDGTTLYFASARKGGQGGADLYKATLGPNGRFSPAENLGSVVNTAGNDNFPGVAPDGTLYFASDGHPGYGKLDIFRYQQNQVTNLGPGINSVGDDFAPFFTKPEVGVFSSNRSGGQGSDDLYSFRKKVRKQVTFYADGTVLGREAEAPAVPLAGAQVTLTNSAGQQQPVVADSVGRFTARLDSGQTYTVVAAQPGRFTARTTLSTVGRSPSPDQLSQLQTDVRLPVTLTLDRIVVNKAIAVNDIFYDYDKAVIRPDAAIRLDTLAQTLRDNPTINIELSSHTDQRGKAAYNLKLSQQRADAAVAYIVSKGIDRQRLTARGYGKTRPLVPNAQTEAESQRNRRTEFKVTRISQ